MKMLISLVSFGAISPWWMALPAAGSHHTIPLPRAVNRHRAFLFRRKPRSTRKGGVEPASLQELYIAVRHGESEANVLGIISSDPSVATAQHGLSPLGEHQAHAAAKDLAEAVMGMTPKPRRVMVVSSPFRRASETAEAIVCGLERALKEDEVERGTELEMWFILDSRLRERNFGRLNGQSTKMYERVWEADAKSASHRKWGCESCEEVLSRVMRLIKCIEGESSRDDSSPADGDAVTVERVMKCSGGKVEVVHHGHSYPDCLPGSVVILVAHGDVLQIAQTAFVGISCHQHRSLDHLTQAEVRVFSR
mmetsp:Transcript_41741/g.104167  ORF Transcript_41741/g.104167 Transcript_41741/m.104167 type:complete len:308 (-) Transcript_41741:178-1101(-)